MEEQLRIQEQKWEEQQTQNKVIQDILKEIMMSLQEMNGRIKATVEKKILKSPTSSVKSTEVHDDGATRIRGYVPKLKFPKFNGTNPRMWIKKYNKYFHLCKIPEEQKVDLACLVEKAEQWVSS